MKLFTEITFEGRPQWVKVFFSKKRGKTNIKKVLLQESGKKISITDIAKSDHFGLFELFSSF